MFKKKKKAKLLDELKHENDLAYKRMLASARKRWSSIKEAIKEELLESAKKYGKSRKYVNEGLSEYDSKTLNDAEKEVIKSWAEGEGLKVYFCEKYVKFDWHGIEVKPTTYIF